MNLDLQYYMRFLNVQIGVLLHSYICESLSYSIELLMDTVVIRLKIKSTRSNSSSFYGFENLMKFWTTFIFKSSN